MYGSEQCDKQRAMIVLSVHLVSNKALKLINDYPIKLLRSPTWNICSIIQN